MVRNMGRGIDLVAATVAKVVPIVATSTSQLNVKLFSLSLPLSEYDKLLCISGDEKVKENFPQQRGNCRE